MQDLIGEASGWVSQTSTALLGYYYVSSKPAELEKQTQKNAG